VWARLVFPLAERLSSDGLLLLASVLYALVVSLLIVGRLVPAAARTTRAAAVVGGVAFAIVALSAGYRLATVDLPTYAVVVAKDDATVRFEPSPAGTVHFQAKPGSVLRVGGDREGWMNVVRADGRRGWIERAALEIL
jgi:Bacterial SH3 domain